MDNDSLARPDEPLALQSNDQLGPLPKPLYSARFLALFFTGSQPTEDAYSASQLRTYAAEQVAAERERLCAAIKAADDKASEGDYMLDSDDCISVIRGTWNPGG